VGWLAGGERELGGDLTGGGGNGTGWLRMAHGGGEGPSYIGALALGDDG
jgi:hypothetical protein